MVKINKIYTKTGDDGTTGLIGGSRVSKDHPRVECYGEIDELNSFIGMARTRAEEMQRSQFVEILAIVQNELFDIGAELATPTGMQKKEALNQKTIQRLEDWIDELNKPLEELRSFILPGGTVLNANLHQCRTVSRRAERALVRLSSREEISILLRQYLNRLSDLFFAMARHESYLARTAEYLWEPQKSLKQ